MPSDGIAAFTGSKGDCYDNALAKRINGSYKNELIYTRTGSDVVDVEIANFDWENWWNETRLHQSLGYRTPMENESEFWSHQPARDVREDKKMPRNKPRGTSMRFLRDPL
ncbi:integrase core domain-containing protein [Corynebacterium sp. S5S1]|uniref:integrase core domain-containing protein n=1 Tax=unclassified Corynebacterium TaxID=2624378 RepID=UPI001CE4220C